jgi:hypothetical protein
MTQITGTIPALLAGSGRIADRRAVQLETAWLIRDHVNASPASTTLLCDARTAVPIHSGQPTLVILSETVPAVTESATAAIRSGNRVYALAPTGWDITDWLHDVPSHAMLIRRVAQAPVAAVLSGDQGWLWMGQHGQGEWRLALEVEQVAAIRLAFLELFWNHAVDEAWPAKGTMRWHARSDAPFDVPRPVSSVAARLDIGDARLPEPGAGGLVYSSDGHLPDGSAARAWVRPSGERHDQLAALVRQGTDIVWSDLGLPTCATGAYSTVLPRTSRWSLRVTLTMRQANALAAILRQEPSATFQTAIGLGDVETQLGRTGRVWLPGHPAPDSLINEQELDAGVVQADSVRNAPTVEPSSWPQPTALALSARWTWAVSVPQALGSAREDPLVQKWRAVDRTYAKRIETALGALADLEQEEGVLKRAFDTLKGVLLGFGRSRSELKTNLLDLTTRTPSAAGPDGAYEVMAQLTRLEDRVRQLSEEVAEAKRQAQTAAERKRQEQEHAAAQQKARADLAQDDEELTGKQQRLAEIDTELGELVKVTNMSKKDRRVRQGKLRDEQDRVRKRIRRLEELVERHRSLIDKPFDFRPPATPATGQRLTGSFVPTATDKDRIPEQALPCVGVLLQAGQVRMLAISRWDELDRGEADANRLAARLVTATEEA